MKKSRLSIGIDPPTNVKDRVEYARNIINETNEFAFAYKPNMQFWLGSSKSDIVEVNDLIHSFDIPSIADLKVSDIGNTNKNAIENLAALGFDYFTHSPFPGNLEETSVYSKDNDMGMITLVVMSNPEAKWMVNGEMYRVWAAEANKYADGIVLGTTNHVTEDILREVSQICKDKFVLAPGIGSQGGDVSYLREIFGQRVLFSVSRGIGLSDNPKKAANSYYEQIMKQ